MQVDGNGLRITADSKGFCSRLSTCVRRRPRLELPPSTTEQARRMAKAATKAATKASASTTDHHKKKPNLESVRYRARLNAADVVFQPVRKYIAVGYRDGWWFSRVRLDDGRYQKRRLARADDPPRTADGKTVLTFSDAQDEALEAAEKIKAGIDKAPTLESSTFTVNDAARYYGDNHDSKSLKLTLRSYETHVAPKFGRRPVAELRTEEIRAWRNKLKNSRARLRSSKAKTNYREQNEDDDPKELERRRKATANRVLTVFKSILNYARNEIDELDVSDTWSRVKPYKDVDAARVRPLDEHEARRLLKACEPHFRDIASAAILTGARYGSLAEMRVSDFELAAGTVYVRRGKTTKSRKHMKLTADGLKLFSRLTQGRKPNAIMFLQPNGRPWGKSDQCRPMDEAITKAKIEPRATFHNLKDTFVTHLIRKGLPFAHISTLVGTSVRMLETHYGHLRESDVEEAFLEAAMKLS